MRGRETIRAHNEGNLDNVTVTVIVLLSCYQICKDKGEDDN